MIAALLFKIVTMDFLLYILFLYNKLHIYFTKHQIKCAFKWFLSANIIYAIARRQSEPEKIALSRGRKLSTKWIPRASHWSRIPQDVRPLLRKRIRERMRHYFIGFRYCHSDRSEGGLPRYPRWELSLPRSALKCEASSSRHKNTSVVSRKEFANNKSRLRESIKGAEWNGTPLYWM